MTYDENDHHKEVYAFAGLALYKAQCLEVEVCNFLVAHQLVTNRTITAEERDAFIDRAERQTLGRLLREMRDVVNIDDDFEDLVADSLEKRNFFVHNYFRDRIAGFITREGRDEMIKELEDFVSLFETADNRIQLLTKATQKALGMTNKHIHPIAAEMFGDEIADRFFGTANTE